MGMDVFGKKPDSKEGEYFRANVWSWRPIHFLIGEAVNKYNIDLDISLFGGNDGAGPDSQEVCDKLADGMERVLRKYGNVISLDGCYVDEEGRLMSPGQELPPGKKKTPAYQTDKGHVLEFIRFLRHCGGFEIC